MPNKTDKTEEVTEIVDKVIEATRLGGGFLMYRETAIRALVDLTRIERRLSPMPKLQAIYDAALALVNQPCDDVAQNHKLLGALVLAVHALERR